MSYISINQNRTLEANRSLKSIVNIPMKMERGWYGFCIGLPKTSKGHDEIWVFMDRLTKIAHFLPICAMLNYISRR